MVIVKLTHPDDDFVDANKPLPVTPVGGGTGGALEVEITGDTVGLATETTLGKVKTAVGEMTDAAETDPAESASVIALLKGLLTQLQGNGSGSAPVALTGSILQECKTQDDADDGVVTFSEPIGTIEIYNTDESNPGVFQVNGINITVPPGTAFKSIVGGTPSANVTITGATSYILNRYE